MKSPKTVPRLAAGLALLIIAALAVACGGAAAEEEPAEEEEVAEEERAAEEAMAEEEEMAPLEEEALIPDAPPQEGELVEGAAPDAEGQLSESASQQVRLVIKDGYITLLVEDIEIALAQVSSIAGRHGGYVLDSAITQGSESRWAEISITVRAEDFDTAMNELRDIAREVLEESTSGQDVTSEFVDLEARLRNLEATAERLRSFLDDAQNVDEALEINEELAAIEGEIEEVRGRMNYLQTRAALSTIHVSLRVDADPTATPTITPTATSTPTPTATSTPTNTPTPTLTPTATPWTPGETLHDAAYVEGNVLRVMLHSVTDALILVAVNVLPTLLPFAALGGIGWVAYRRWQRKRNGAGPDDIVTDA